MTHFRLDPPRINKEDRKQRSSYRNECLERFTADDMRCSYGILLKETSLHERDNRLP